MLRNNIDLMSLFIRLLILIPSLTIHEMAHGIAANLLGDHTAKEEGRISFNPLKHIDPIGFLFLMIFGFGWAKPVMTDPRHFKEPKIDMAITAFAGPASNFLLAIITLLIYAILEKSKVYIDPNISNVIISFVYINVALGVFNLLPIPPLDGSKVLGVFLPDNVYWKFISLRNGFIFIIILSYMGLLEKILVPIITFVFNSFIQLAEKII